MGRFSQDEEETIREAASALRTAAVAVSHSHGEPPDDELDDLADQLDRMVDGRPPLTLDTVEDALADAFSESTKWTAGNYASKQMARRMERLAETCRERVFAAFLGAPQGHPDPGLTNADLYSQLPQFSTYTINRRVSELKRYRLIEECDTREMSAGTLMTAHRPAPAVRAYYDGADGPQESIW
jgi:hypothetical protein